MIRPHVLPGSATWSAIRLRIGKPHLTDTDDARLCGVMRECESEVAAARAVVMKQRYLDFQRCVPPFVLLAHVWKSHGRGGVAEARTPPLTT